MKKYTVTWGWEPPQFDHKAGGIRLFYNTKQIEREVTYKDLETEEETTEIITEWLCDVVEYNREECQQFFNLSGLEAQKWLLKEKINAYDTSKYVESFSINGVEIWLGSELRNKVRENLETCNQFNETETILRFNGMAFPVSVEQGWQMYYLVLKYARDCWNDTQEHLAEVEKLQSIEDVKNYNYKSGYPEKLTL